MTRIWQVEFFGTTAKYNVESDRAEDAIEKAKKYAGTIAEEGLYGVRLLAETSVEPD